MCVCRQDLALWPPAVAPLHPLVLGASVWAPRPLCSVLAVASVEQVDECERSEVMSLMISSRSFVCVFSVSVTLWSCDQTRSVHHACSACPSLFCVHVCPVFLSCVCVCVCVCVCAAGAFGGFGSTTTTTAGTGFSFSTPSNTGTGVCVCLSVCVLVSVYISLSVCILVYVCVC